MSKLTDIKNKIDQLDGGAFQNLCDAYLAYRGYENGYSLGMDTGTNKTAKGNPDTYFLTADKHYIFAMYTTQKNNFLQKAIEDIDKCFDEDKTGIKAEIVAEIIYCHTYGRLSPGDDRRLREHCQKQGALLTLIGLDELSNDIFKEYPILAKDFLGISIDSGQIMSLETFVAKHDAIKMSAPLDTEFLFRKDEIEKATSALHKNDILLIGGKAGVGKTRFAIELCRQLAATEKYNVLVIKNNNLRLYDDLVSAIEEGREYLVFVDDADQLFELNHILNYLAPVSTSSRHIAKLIFTVRDYARKQVMDKIMEVSCPEFIKITALKDEDIQKLIATCYGITNELYVNRITEIAEGNARLAMLAGKLAAGSDSLAAIRDASDLYHSYYGNQLRAITGSETSIYSAGILAFIDSIHLDYLNNLKPIFDVLGITAERFVADLKLLHEAEIVDLCNDKAARISDQSFGNYLIKYVFIDQKAIQLSTMIETCFYISNSRTVATCNMLLHVFNNSTVNEYIKSQIRIVWDRLKLDEKRFPSFFNAFHMIHPAESLLLLQSKILQESPRQFDVSTLTFKDDQPNGNISDDILKVLSSYTNHADLSSAIELLLQYYKKRPDLYAQFYNTIAGSFGFDINSIDFGYYTQVTVVECLCTAVEKSLDDVNFLCLFVRVARYFLRLNFQNVMGGRHNTISLYTLKVSPDDAVFKYRKRLLSTLLLIYKHGKMRTEIEHALEEYGIPNYQEEDDPYPDVIRAEFDEVLAFLSVFAPTNLYHCVIARHLGQIAKQINYDASIALFAFLSSRKYNIYSSLVQNYQEDPSLSNEQKMQNHKDRVYKLLDKCTPQDIDCLINVCAESVRTFDKECRRLLQGLSYAFEALQEQKHLYLYLVGAYMKANTPYQIDVSKIVEKLFEFLPTPKVHQFITQYNYNQKNVWLWLFFVLIPEKQVTKQLANDLLFYVGSPATELNYSPYRPIDLLNKYEKVAPGIIFKALRIITNHYEESPFLFSTYAFFLLNHTGQSDVAAMLKQFSEELVLLEDIYIKAISYSNSDDYDGGLLFAISAIDNSFLYRYLDQILDAHSNAEHSNHYSFNRLVGIWNTIEFTTFADMIFDYLYERKDILTWIYPSPFESMLCVQADCQEAALNRTRWIEHTIERYSPDGDRMYELFSAIAELPCEDRKKAIEKFLTLNSNPEIFAKLPLESSICGGFGSMIPYIQNRINFLSSLLPSVSGLKYLKQRQRIEQEIEHWKADIRSEEIRELLDSWYN